MYQLENWLRNLLSKLQKEKRWEGFNTSYQESVLEHSVKMALIVELMLAYEQKVNNPHKLDFYSLLQCAINHDIGESIVGDILYDDKTPKDEENEAKVFEGLIAQVIPLELRCYFPLPIDMSPDFDQKHKDFWKAAERIGYCMFALAEDNPKFDEIVTRHVLELEKNNDFFSISKICDVIKSDHQERLNARQ